MESSARVKSRRYSTAGVIILQKKAIQSSSPLTNQVRLPIFPASPIFSGLLIGAFRIFAKSSCSMSAMRGTHTVDRPRQRGSVDRPRSGFVTAAYALHQTLVDTLHHVVPFQLLPHCSLINI